MVSRGKPPKDVFDTYFNFITSDLKTLIIGTSLGGHFAAWLGAETGYPFIAINNRGQYVRSLVAFIKKTAREVLYQ